MILRMDLQRTPCTNGSKARNPPKYGSLVQDGPGAPLALTTLLSAHFLLSMYCRGAGAAVERDKARLNKHYNFADDVKQRSLVS